MNVQTPFFDFLNFFVYDEGNKQNAQNCIYSSASNYKHMIYEKLQFPKIVTISCQINGVYFPSKYRKKEKITEANGVIFAKSISLLIV